MCFCCLVRLCCCPLLFLFDPSVLFYLLFMVFNFVALFPFFFVFDVYIICVALLFRSRKRKKKTAHTRNLPTQSACELSCFSSLYVYVYITYTYTLRIRYICIRSVYVIRYTPYIYIRYHVMDKDTGEGGGGHPSDHRRDHPTDRSPPRIPCGDSIGA